MTREPKTSITIKEIVRSNTYEIREEQELTQKQLGEVLGVSDRMIQNYEAGREYSLPIEKAMMMHKLWNYSLDQIYIDFSKKTLFDKFHVDIRDILSFNGDNIVFSIPDYYWEFIHELKNIKESDSLEVEKKRLIKRLEGKYTNKTHSVIWKYEIPLANFFSMLKIGETEIPYANEDKSVIDYKKPTEEQLKEVSDFLEEILKGDHT